MARAKMPARPVCPYCGIHIQHRNPSTCWARVWSRLTRPIPTSDRERIEFGVRRDLVMLSHGRAEQIAARFQMLAAGGAVEVGR